MVCLAVDKGLQGAMVVMREAPQAADSHILENVHVWKRYRSTPALEADIARLQRIFGSLAFWSRVDLVALEQATSIWGFRHVGVAQANFGGRVKAWADELRLPWIEVPARTNAMHAETMQVYGRQVRRFVREDRWEDVLDAIAIAEWAIAETRRRSR